MLLRQRRGLAAFENIRKRWFADGLGDGRELFDVLRCFDKAHVGAGFKVGVHAVERGRHAFDGACIGARDDHHVGIAPGIYGGLDLADHLAFAHELLAFVVAAFLGRDLVLQVKRSDPGFLIFAHGAHDVHRVAETAVHVADDGNLDGFDRA